jgi:uncharacterized repeat protein (TIGR01451 family)
MAMMQTIKFQASRDGQANRQARQRGARPGWPRLLGLAAIELMLGMLFLLPFWQQVASAHEAPGGLAANSPAGGTSHLASQVDTLRTDSRSNPAAPLQQGAPTTLTVSILSSPYAILDNNDPTGAGGPVPNVFVVEAVVTNTGSAMATDVVVNLDYNPSVINNWVLVTGENPERSIQQLAPNEAYHVFWLARYSTVIGAIHQYTVTASAENAGLVSTSSNFYAPASDRTVTTVGALSSGNSGITQVSANIVVGVAFTISVRYDLGQNPNYAVFSPAGNPDFNSGAYRLLASQVRFHDKNGTFLSAVDNRLYFPTLPGSAAEADAIFTFIALAPENTRLCPYTGIGYQSNDKYDQFYCEGTQIVPVTGTLSLSLTKQADLVVQQNQRLTYTLRYTNSGSLPLQNVWVWDDVVTATASVVTSTLDPAGDADETSASRAAWYVGAVATSPQVTSTGTLTFAALVNGNGLDLPDGTLLVNHAFYGISPGNLPDVKALTGTFTTTVQAPTITLSKTDGQATVQPGGALTYSLRITNSGSMTATALVITDALPADVAYAGGAEPGGSVYNPAQRTITWNLASLAPDGGTYVLTVPVTLGLKVPNGTFLTNTLQVKYENPAGWVYSVKTATDTTTVGAPVLSIAKSDFPDPVLTGRLITYTLHYTNSGPAAATNVLITDVLPLSTTYQTCTPPACDLYGNVVSWTVGTVPASSSGAVTFTVLVSSELQTGDLIENKSYGISADQADFIAGPPVATAVNRDAGTIQGYAFDDANVNGIMDSGESGLSGVTVTLTIATVPVTTTDSNGYYSFRVETEEPISVTADLPANTFRTTPGAVFTDNVLGITQTINFGYASTSSGLGAIYGTVFDDANHDGSQDLGESGLAGVTITSAEAMTSPLTTNPYGVYTLRYNTSGSTTIHETNPAFYVSTTPDTVTTAAVINSAGPSPVDFGDFLGIQITGQVFSDANVNGANDGEAGVAGAAVAADGDSFSPTGSSGVYTLYVSVSNGNSITIAETDPAGYVSTNAVPGAGMSRVDANTLRIGSPVSGTIYSGDFGDVQASGAVTVSGTVWNDNGAGTCLANGLQDCGELGLAGAVVGLSSGLTQTTLADGAFSLPGPAGTVITVTETNPAGGYVSTNAIPDPSHAVQKVDNDRLRVSSLTGGVTSSGNLFGDVLTSDVAVITGTVFDDADQSGTLNGGETGFADIAVTLEYSDGHTISVPTDGAGHYQLAVAPGTDVRITSATPAGSPTYYATTPQSVVVRPPTAGLFPDNNFGFSNDARPVIYGIVFDDRNSNGVQDLGELGLAGAVVTCTDGTTISVTTGGVGLITGTFTFPVTPTGIYGLHEHNPPSYRSTTPDDLYVNVFALSRSYFVDFGDTNNAAMASIYGTVFDDLNMNGVQDPDETGLDGVVISVTVSAGGGGSGWLTTTTKAYGQFSYGFDINEQGYHTIQEQDPAKVGYHSTTPDEVNQYILLNNSYIVDFGDVNNNGVATILGTVFDDVSGDGVQQLSELGLAGVTVSLSDGQTTTTNSNGGYTFAVDQAGPVQVIEIDRSGYHSTTPNTVTVDVAAPTGQVYTVNYGDRLNSQAGVSFFGTVFEDVNVSRARDTTESGLEGVTVTISTVDGTPVPSTVTTNEWGQYTFLIENPGTYTVTETDLAGYLSTNAIPGSLAVFRVDDNTLSTTVASIAGADMGDNLFGDVQASQAITISGTVWDDNGAGVGGIGGDGQRNGSEPGLAGAVVSLSSGPTQTTGLDGAFLLHAPAGQVITVTEANPAGYLSTNAIAGTGATRFNNDTLVVTSTLGGGNASAGNLFGDVISTTLGLSKSAADVNGGTLLEGDTIRYTLRVTNTGSYTAFDVTLTDNLPNQVTCQSVGGDYAPGGCADPLIWTIPSLPGSSVATLYITVTINAGTAGQTITNTGGVTGSNVPNPPDPPPAVCLDGSLPVGGICPTPVPTTTLSLVKSAADVNGPPLVEGDSVRYTLQVANTGTYTAFNVTVTDNLPDQVTCRSVAGTYAPGCADPLIWTIPSLPASGVATLYITVTIDTGTAGQTITNTGSVTSSNVPNPPDPPPAVCLDGSLPVGGICPTPVPVVSPGFDKRVSYNLPLAVGDQITYTLQITGSPAYTAFNVVVVDTWPVSVTLVDSTTTQGNAISGTGLITWTVGNVAPSATAALNLTGRLNEDAAGQLIANTGTLTGSNVTGARDGVTIFVGNCLPDAYEPDNTIDQAGAFDFALPSFSQSRNFYVPADRDWLRLTVQAGVVYTFATSNLGPLADTVLSLYAEDGTTLLAENDDASANVQDSLIVWTAPLTPRNQTVYLVVWQTSYNADSCRTAYTLSLTQTVGGDLGTSTKTVTPSQADLGVGDPVTYTIALTNSDLSMAAAPVTVTDTLPPTITLGSVQECGGSGQYELYQYDTAGNGFTWVGALDAGASLQLCVYGTVAITPWTSINTAWISWKDQVVSVTAAGSVPPLPSIGGVYLPIIMSNSQ